MRADDGLLGYKRFGVQGATGAARRLRSGPSPSESVKGIHINMLAVRRDRHAGLADAGGKHLPHKQLNYFLKEEIGYQGARAPSPDARLRPHGLSGRLAAWLIEKFRAWTDCNGDPEKRRQARDEMLAIFRSTGSTGAIGSSFWPYYARMHGPWPIPKGRRRCTIRV